MKSGGTKTALRAEALGMRYSHGRTYSEAPGFIRGRADNRALSSFRHDNGLAAQLRVIPLLDGCIEGIHVDMH